MVKVARGLNHQPILHVFIEINSHEVVVPNPVVRDHEEAHESVGKQSLHLFEEVGSKARDLDCSSRRYLG